MGDAYRPQATSATPCEICCDPALTDEKAGATSCHFRRTTNIATHVLTITQPWLRLNCSLGEGPFWEEDTNSLRFLDVEKQKVHRVDLNVGPSSHKVLKEYDISIGFVISQVPYPPSLTIG